MKVIHDVGEAAGPARQIDGLRVLSLKRGSSHLGLSSVVAFPTITD